MRSAGSTAGQCYLAEYEISGSLIFVHSNKFFELPNDLGNVLVTITDKKIPIVIGSSISYYTADVVSANDYYSFGMTMPGRSYSASSSSYRFGFNGQEKSTEIESKGNSYTAEFWQYDARIGRRWNVDPVTKDDESPYMTFGNNPIVMVDPNGADWYHKNGDKNKDNLSWFDGNGKQKGYKLDKRGTGFWTDRNKNNVSLWYGKSGEDIQMAGSPLQNVVVRSSKPGKAAPLNYLNIPDYNKADVDRWDSYRATVRDLSALGKPLNYAGAPSEYLSLLPNLKREWQVDQDWRSTQYYMLDFATMFVPVPKVGMLRWFGSATGRVFWSGGGTAGKAFASATEHALLNGGTTLERTTTGKVLTWVTTKTGENAMTGRLWSFASRQFAKGAAGDVHMFMDLNKVNPYGFWFKQELPILTSKGLDIITHIK